MAIRILHTRWCRPGPSFTYMFLAKKNCQTGQVWGIHNDMSYTHVCHITAKLLHSAHTITSTTSSVTFLAIIHCVIKLDIHISANLLTKENITSTLKWRRIFSWYLVKPGIYTCNYACTLTSELPWLGVTQICKLGAKFLVERHAPTNGQFGEKPVFQYYYEPEDRWLGNDIFDICERYLWFHISLPIIMEHCQCSIRMGHGKSPCLIIIIGQRICDQATTISVLPSGHNLLGKLQVTKLQCVDFIQSRKQIYVAILFFLASSLSSWSCSGSITREFYFTCNLFSIK